MASLAKLGWRFGQGNSAGVFKITPRFAFAAAGLILAVALLWVGFVEKHETQRVATGAAVSNPVLMPPLAAAGWGVESLITAAALEGAPAIGGAASPAQSGDNVSVLAYSGAVMVALTMFLLAYGRYWGVAPGNGIQQHAVPGRRTARQS